MEGKINNTDGQNIILYTWAFINVLVVTLVVEGTLGSLDNSIKIYSHIFNVAIKYFVILKGTSSQISSHSRK